ncbi:Uncharacterized membrane protein [Parasphingorhabdus marina DSM 22363]|uniref:Uncharacterized membrane protein n=1 Tax=Parasphingorhabdus marina DSM 22363 TaxID=1123272 RepID=A0A1N6DAV5_9SPHN|nr:DUF819 family protein [Parasphingorhabdus marina]SIN67930.1 Uncharacterized membrane protein [Parasphingorhabdus marina DSM 22363]
MPLITNDIVTFGLLSIMLGVLFYARSLGGGWTKFFTFVPIVLLCYLIPSLLNSFGVISSEDSGLWDIAKNYFLPAALILLTLSIDLKAVWGLGPKALIMFFTATVGIIIGGPLAIMIVGSFSPETVGGSGADATWRGLATLAGSWIGGGANQTAMLEVYGYNPERYSAMVAIDIVVANIWMAFLLYGAGNADKIDAWLKADSSAIATLRDKMANFSLAVERKSTVEELMVLLAIAFGGVGLAHFGAGLIGPAFASAFGSSEGVLSSSFFWIVVISTTLGLGLSFTRARDLEGAGASKFGTVMIFLLVAIIGTKMDIFRMAEQPLLMLVGIIWMLIHTILLFIVAKIIRAPFFFIAVGSKANVGGAASAPVVAGAFHPALAPVGVLLAVLGYALGTYGAIMTAELMRMVAP